MKYRHILLTAITLGVLAFSAAAAPRELLNNGWKFSLGDASDKMADFTHGTEYFTYLCKVKTTNQGHAPIMPEFDDSAWRTVSLPHDWVVDLPYSAEASHSHGYKCLGWKYPQNSVGWYRKSFFIPKEAEGQRITVEFEGIFRDAEVFCNGVYLGHERSGYVSQTYDLSDVLNYGEQNLLTVRVDASLEEGWFYEGAGIYRNVYLSCGSPLALEPYGGLKVTSTDNNRLDIQANMRNFGAATSAETEVCARLFEADGTLIRESSRRLGGLAPQQACSMDFSFDMPMAKLWSPDSPYLYTLELQIGEDITSTRVGIRTVEFTHDNGLLLNGERIQMRGCDLHQDQAGVGAGIPDELWRHKLGILKDYGFNTIRSSHNPASPAFLDICDELGFMVIDENRLMGPGDEQLDVLRHMIRRDFNHPSIVLWSVGNEEWAIEWNIWGTKIASRMTAVAHREDPGRQTVYASSSGQYPNYGCDVFGYNYIIQNPVMENWQNYPNAALGTEETSGCGTRGKYRTVPEEGWMTSFNRGGVAVDTRYSEDSLNVIERGWKFYRDHPQFAGLCYWTGFDYRGESNPMVWPATGSQFGIFDYCGYPKDEAFYLKAAWTDEPVLHICGEYNSEIWVYTNCTEVTIAQGMKARRFRNIPSGEHLVFPVSDTSKHPVKVEGIKDGRKYSAVYPAKSSKEGITLKTNKVSLKTDGQDVIVIDITSNNMQDSPAGTSLYASVKGAEFLGWGNGNPGFKEVERPVSGNWLPVKLFSGKAQIIIRSEEGHKSGDVIEINVDDNLIALVYE